MLNESIWIRDIMVTSLVTVSPDDHVLDVIDRLLQAEISGAPVIDNLGMYHGVLSEKSCLDAFSTIVEHTESRCGSEGAPVHASEFMNRRLVTLPPDMDAVKAIEYLLQHRISGAPVVNKQGEYLGVFSESSALKFVISLSYDQLPSSDVAAFMNAGRGRVVNEQTTLERVREIYRCEPHRRLPVLTGDRVVGQISRRDALRAELTRLANHLNSAATDQLANQIGFTDSDAGLTVGHFMDRTAVTIEPDKDLMSAAHIFFSTSARRLPVLENGKLAGQVSRRDVLRAASTLLEPAPEDGPQALYLSSLA
ncbi:MAG: hypothetical protein CMJ78_23395 [Planctomycetaceae bacterium]|nr:hypothetical protein [Planctomycetaceae bacterium]